MKILVVETGFLPYEKEISDDPDMRLSDMQKVVDGHIQAIYPFKEPVALVCNEEGIGQFPFNRMIPEREYGAIFGTFLMCGIGDEDFISLTPKQVKTYTDRFKKAEMILAVNGGSPVIAKVTARQKRPAEKSKQPPKHPRG